MQDWGSQFQFQEEIQKPKSRSESGNNSKYGKAFIIFPNYLD